MATPTNRQQFKDYCLRNLGKPIIEINVTDEQVDDRIDDALRYYWDYHFDGSEKLYYRFEIQEKNRPGKLTEIEVMNGGVGYQNSDTISFSNVGGSNAAANVVTDANGTITEVVMTDHGSGYYNAPVVTVNTSTGSNAALTAYPGGYIPLPENVIGAINIFDSGLITNTNDMFNVQYQFFLNELYSLTSTSIVPYYMSMSHIQFLQELLVGKQPVRYNRHKNKLYVDMNWGKVSNGQWLIAEVYEIVNPDLYKDVWKDRWLLEYATQLIKQQWGGNMKKFIGIQMANGVMMNGQQIYNEATETIAEMRKEMINSYSLPAMDFIG